MATICADLMTTRLFDIKEIFGRLEPEKFYECMEDRLLLMIDEILNDVGNRYMPKTWNYMPVRLVRKRYPPLSVSAVSFLNSSYFFYFCQSSELKMKPS